VVVYNLNIYRAGRSGRPFKTDPLLIVDADAALAFAVPFQGFKTVARQGRKIADRRGRLEAVQLQTCGPLDAGKGFDPFSNGELGGPLVLIADDYL
jgi:hypothetical protein